MLPVYSTILNKPLDIGTKTYLSAIGASAIYVSIDDGSPVSVGAARDLDKALTHLQTIISPTVAFGWVAWSSRYDVLVEIAQEPDLLHFDSGEAIPLAQLVGLIELKAQQRGVTLTPHSRAPERAQVYAKFLDDTLDAMQDSGEFAAFNAAYKAHRQEARARGESVQPYWAVMTDLRGVVIRALVTNRKMRLQPSAILEEIRKHFPWLARTMPNGRRKRSKATR